MTSQPGPATDDRQIYGGICFNLAEIAFRIMLSLARGDATSLRREFLEWSALINKKRRQVPIGIRRRCEDYILVLW